MHRLRVTKKYSASPLDRKVLQENLLGEPDFYCDLLQFYFSFDSKEDSVSTKVTVSFCNSHDQKAAQRTKGKKISASFLPLDFVNKSATETCFLFSPVGLTHCLRPSSSCLRRTEAALTARGQIATTSSSSSCLGIMGKFPPSFLPPLFQKNCRGPNIT